jgi:hypothetical protein
MEQCDKCKLRGLTIDGKGGARQLLSEERLRGPFGECLLVDDLG